MSRRIIPATLRQELVLARLRALGGINVSIYALVDALDWPLSTTQGVLEVLLEAGDVTGERTQRRAAKLWSLSPARLVEWHESTAAVRASQGLAEPEPKAPALPTRQEPINTAGLTGPLLSAARILNALSSDKRADPRYLACQGGYSYTRARELHAEIMGRAG